MSEEQQHHLALPQKNSLFKRLVVVLGVIALLVGGKVYVAHAEQGVLEKQHEEQAFVTEVGRMPHPKGRNKGEPDLHITVRLNLPLLTISLLNQGADVHAKDNDGDTPLHRAAFKDASSTAAVLLSQGADVHAKDNDGDTPLHRTASDNASSTATVLLSQGADANAKNNDGDTPLHTATRNYAAETAEVLRRYGGRE